MAVVGHFANSDQEKAWSATSTPSRRPTVVACVMLTARDQWGEWCKPDKLRAALKDLAKETRVKLPAG